MGILTDVLKNVEAALNRLKSAIYGAKENTKEKEESSRAELEVE